MSFNQSRFKPMKRWIVVFSYVSMLCTGVMAFAKGPEVGLVDNKLSINAEAIPLARLLQLVDLATGMKSKVPPELANRNISVKFSGLTLADGVRKIFQGQPLDYIMVQGQGIIVTAASQTGQTASAGELPASSNPPPAVQSFEQPFVQDFPSAQTPQAQQLQQLQQQQLQQQQLQQQPMVQTPFGPIPNPRAQQPQQVTPTTPQNSLFPQLGQAPGQAPNQPIGQPVPAFPSPNPTTTLGTPNPFGTPNQPGVNQTNPNIQNNQNNQNNGLFGNVPVFGSPGTQQR